jgi:uncharacterized delta-60 repeat protein
MKRELAAICVAFASVLAAPGQAAWGDRDCSFGNAGVASLPVDYQNYATNEPVSAILEANGNIVTRFGYKHGYTRMARVDASGAPLPMSYNPQGGPGFQDLTDAALPTGRLLLLGDWSMGSTVHGPVKAYLPDGSVDTTFGSNGIAVTSAPFFPRGGPLVQPDGKILVAGTLQYNSTNVAALARFNADGTPDAGFGSGGVAMNTAVVFEYRSISLQADGRIVALGPGRLARHLADGQVDPSFASGPLDLSWQAMQVRVQSSGKIVVLVQGDIKMLLARYDASGNPETSRPVQVPGLPSGADTFGRDDSARSLLLMPDDRPVVVGAIMNTQQTVVQGAIVRMNPDLTDDVGRLLDFQPKLVRLLPDGKLLVGAGDWSFVQLRKLLGDGHPSTCAATTTTILPTSPNPSGFGQMVTFSATVTAASGTPAGSVFFKRNGVNLTVANLVSGTATTQYQFTPTGTHAVTATYSPSGSAHAESSSAGTVTHVVNPSMSIDDPTANSATQGPTMSFRVSLGGGAASSSITVDYATVDQTAKAGTDYTATAGTLTFAPGETTKYVAVPLTPQSAPSPSKSFFLSLSNPSGTTLSKSIGQGTIVYASSGLAVYVADASVAEGYSGTTLLGFTVSLSAPHTSTLTVQYAMQNVTAVGGVDYTAHQGTLTFLPGQTHQWVMVPIAANATPQADRTFFVNLTGTSAGVIARAQATGTIVDDDPTPAASQVAMYRLFSDVTKEHLYTTDANEYAVLPSRGWIPEGVAYKMFGSAGSYGALHAVPFYRLYHPGILQHHWTTDWYEVWVLVGTGAWQYEGIAGYLLPAAASGTMPLYRLSYPFPPLHLWTSDAYEKDVVSTQYGWTYEGVVGEVLP